MNLLLLPAFVAAVASTAVCQSQPPTELTPSEANRTTLLPPEDVRTRQEGGSLFLEWQPPRIKRVTDYKIFRIDKNAAKPLEIGQTQDTRFDLGKASADD